MAVATTTALLLGLGGAAAGIGASKMMTPKSQVSSPMALPQPPSIESASDNASKIIKAKKASATQSIYTSPLGVSGQADIAKKTLLGT